MFFSKNYKIGITGLSQCGKTVFLTSFLNNLLNFNEINLPYLKHKELTVHASIIDKSDTYPLFKYHEFLDNFRNQNPDWPRHTQEIYKFYLDLKCISSDKTYNLNLEFIDYPGELTIDFPLKSLSYNIWSDEVYSLAKRFPEKSKAYLNEIEKIKQFLLKSQAPDLNNGFETEFSNLTISAFRAYKEFVRQMVSEHIFLAPAIVHLNKPYTYNTKFPLCPIPSEIKVVEKINTQLSKAFQDYISNYVEKHFNEIKNCNCQIILIDIIEILKSGIEKFNYIRNYLEKILNAFTYKSYWEKLTLPVKKGINRFFSILNFNKPFSTQTEKFIFIATKADLVSLNDRIKLKALLKNIISHSRISILKKETNGNVIFTYCCANKSTQDQKVEHKDEAGTQLLDSLKGYIRNEEGKIKLLNIFPGVVPANWPDDEESWKNLKLICSEFLPARLTKREDVTIPHINLDKIIYEIFAEALK